MTFSYINLSINLVVSEIIRTFVLMNKELVIEYHKPMSGFVRITDGIEIIIMMMQEFDKLPADPEKRDERLKAMLYGQ